MSDLISHFEGGRYETVYGGESEPEDHEGLRDCPNREENLICLGWDGGALDHQLLAVSHACLSSHFVCCLCGVVGLCMASVCPCNFCLVPCEICVVSVWSLWSPCGFHVVFSVVSV